MTHAVHYFVCGTLADRKGFEFSSLGKNPLPGRPPTYLDVSPTSFSGESHTFSRVEIEGATYVRYARYRGINPSDKGANRGAYMAAGFLVNHKMPPHAASAYIDLATRIFFDLSRHLGPGNAFARDFDLQRYRFPGLPANETQRSELSSVVLTDLLLQAINADKAFKKNGGQVSVSANDFTKVGSAAARTLYLSGGKKQPRQSVDTEREGLRLLAQRIVMASNQLKDLHAHWKQQAHLVAQGAAGVGNSSEQLGKMVSDIESHMASVHKLASAAPAASAVPATAQAARPAAAPQAPPRATGPRQKRPAPSSVDRDTPLTFDGGPGTQVIYDNRPSTPRPPDPPRSKQMYIGSKTMAVGIGLAVALTITALVLSLKPRGPSDSDTRRPEATRPVSGEPRPMGYRDDEATGAPEKGSVAEERAALDEQPDQSDNEKP